MALPINIAIFASAVMKMLSDKPVVYFPGLNGLRFIAALAVIVTHVELIKGVFGYKSWWQNTLYFHLGSLGVYFFFVLSGFLITYLLLVEKARIGRISIKQFYIRRILRIWPLYYFIVIIGFFILPQFPQINIRYLEHDFQKYFTENLVLYIFILPNLAFSLFRAVPHIGQAWSIGVEEQFYLAWPWLIAKSQNLLKTLLYVLVIIVCIKAFVLLAGLWFSASQWYPPLKAFLAMSKFECMAIGSLGGLVLYNKSRIALSVIFNNITYYSSLAALPLLLYCVPEELRDGMHLPFSFAFLCIIMNVAGNRKLKWLLENRPMNYLGKISYGIYMYHLMIIPIVIYFLARLPVTNSIVVYSILVYGLSILLTIGVSGLSYAMIEKKFIRLKLTFTKIRSGTPSQDHPA